MIILAQSITPMDFFLFPQPKLECKPCVCHPECHCETKCVQQQILKECNLGVDSHNALAVHHTEENRITRLILISSLSVNFILILLLILRKPVRNCYRKCQLRKQEQAMAKQQAAAHQQTERFTLALRQLIPSSSPQASSQQNTSGSTPSRPIFQFLSNMNQESSA